MNILNRLRNYIGKRTKPDQLHVADNGDTYVECTDTDVPNCEYTHKFYYQEVVRNYWGKWVYLDTYLCVNSRLTVKR